MFGPVVDSVEDEQVSQPQVQEMDGPPPVGPAVQAVLALSQAGGNFARSQADMRSLRLGRATVY